MGLPDSWRRDLLGGVAPGLDGDLGHLRARVGPPRSPRHRPRVAHDEHVGMTGQRQVGLERAPARPGRAPRAATPPRCRRRSRPPPTPRPRRRSTRPSSRRTPLSVTSATGTVHADVDATRAQGLLGVGAGAAPRSPARRRSPASSRMTRVRSGSMPQPVPAHRHVEQLDQRPRHLHAGGAAAHHHEGRGARRRSPRGGRRRPRGSAAPGSAAAGRRPACTGAACGPRRPATPKKPVVAPVATTRRSYPSTPPSARVTRAALEVDRTHAARGGT